MAADDFDRAMREQMMNVAGKALDGLMPQIDGFADDVAEMTRAERDELEDRLFAVLSAVYAVRSALAASDVEAAHSAAAQAILQLSDILQELSDG